MEGNTCNSFKFNVILSTGAFSSCHDYVDPEPYHETCVYDLCVTLPDEELRCNNFESYADACRDAGGNTNNWRDAVPACGKCLSQRGFFCLK